MGVAPSRRATADNVSDCKGVNRPRGNGPNQPLRPGLTAVNDEPTPAYTGPDKVRRILANNKDQG
jgi:hypothetical protein